MRLTVGRKLLLLASLSAVLMLLVGAVGFWGTQSASARTHAMLEGEAKILENSARVRANILGLRRYEKDLFLNVGDAAKVADYDKKWDAQREHLVSRLDALAAVSVLPGDRERVAKLRADLAAYVTGMTGIRANVKSGAIRTPQQGNVAVGQFKDATHNLEKSAEAFAKDAVGRMATIAQALGDAARQGLIVIGVLALVAIGVGLGLAVLISRSITRPLGRTVEALDAVSSGDLTAHLDVRGHDEIARVAHALNESLAALRGTLSTVRAESQNAAGASQELSAATEQLSSGAQEQASSLEETAASLEQITGTVKQTADNARQANALAAASRDAAEKGGAVVREAVTAMGEITTASKRIADIIGTIDEIAFQTNLLALNAAVEAARAGEQGRGFAVVAAEVRNLAQRAAGAAKEIKGLIQDSVGKVETGASLVNRSGATLDEIVGSVKRVTDLIAEIAAASQEQSSGIDQVNRAVAQMDQVVQRNAAQTEELSSTAQALSGQAQRLQAEVARFQLGDAHEAPVAAAPRAPSVPKAPVAAPKAPGAKTVTSREPVVATASNGRNGHHDGFEEF